ncbi:WD40 repeat domain-containing protein [Sporobolomyces koalae]|uniref:WD40 repeat domain-containing protein n=1 Tax=Sporobolomyces koalae TaxID=500713 RepID=UPI003176BE94
MPHPQLDAHEQAHRLIARFLSHQDYQQTLATFLSEAAAKHPHLRLSAAPVAEQGEDWNDVLEAYLARKMSQASIDDGDSRIEQMLNQLSVPNDTVPHTVRTVVKEATNILNVCKGVLPRKEWDSQALEFKSSTRPCIFTTTVDKTLKVWSRPSRATSSRNPLELLESHSFPSPVLSFAQHPQRDLQNLVACATMEGGLVILDLVSRQQLVKLRDHSKYIPKVVWAPDGRHLVTLGYDKLINVYSVSYELAAAPADSVDSEESRIALTLVHSLHPRTNPEAAVFLPNSSHLVWTARDDHLLHYLAFPSSNSTSTDSEQPWKMTDYNLNPNQDSFTSFSILALSVHPTLPLLSLQTSTAAARIFLYPFHSTTRLRTIHTGAQQSDYFNPRHAWTAAGDKVVVNSEDGIVRVCDLTKGGIERLRKGCHGIAAPLADDEDDDDVVDAQAVGDELRSERAKARRERDRGSSVVRDVEIVELEDHSDGTVGSSWVVLSAGFDKTVRMII